MSRYYYKYGLFCAGACVVFYVLVTLLLYQIFSSVVWPTILLNLSLFIFYGMVRISDRHHVLLSDSVSDDFSEDLSFRFPVVMVFLIRIMTFFLMFALPDLLYSASFEEYTKAMSEFPDALGLLLALVFAPLGEEAIMRGLFFPFLRNSIGAPAAIFATSILFAVMHPSPLHMIMTFCLSIILCYAYMLTNSFTFVVFLHSLFNFSAYLFVYEPELHPVALGIICATCVLLVIFGIVFYTVCIRKKLFALRKRRLPYFDLSFC